jgi:hypothetical protein
MSKHKKMDTGSIDQLYNRKIFYRNLTQNEKYRSKVNGPRGERYSTGRAHHSLKTKGSIKIRDFIFVP